MRCSPQKQTSFVSPKEKQIDYILTKRRYLGHVKDAEANDATHMGSDHRCVMAIFLITMLGKDIHTKNKEKKHDTIGYDEHSILNCPSLKKDTKKSLTQQKKPPPRKEMKYITQGRTQKHKSKEKTPQQQKLTAHLRKQKHKRSKEEA